MPEKLRIAILGCGRFNRSHVRAMTELKDELVVTHAVDKNIDRAREVAEMTGAKAVTSLHDIWDEFDAIDICTPHFLHAPQTMEALRRGKDVLVEKPMAIDPDDAEAIVRFAEMNDNVLMVGYVLRYHPLVRAMRDHVLKETFGRPLFVTMATEDYYEPHTEWLRWIGTRGGGVLLSHGCHYIDLLIWLFGPVRRATCMKNKLVMDALEGEETAIALCEFTTGVIGTYTASQATKHGRRGLTVSINCEKGRLDLNLREGTLTVDDGNERVLFEGASGKPIRAQLEHFIQCVRERKVPLTSGRSALASHRAIWEMYAAEKDDRIARIW